MKTDVIAELLKLPGLPNYLVAVEDQMRTAVAPANSVLRRSALTMIDGKSKRLRPILVIALAAVGGTKIDSQVIRLAAAVELAHLATLVHDDLMDQADTRWGRPTIASREGANRAIVTGDYLLSLSIAEAAAVSKEAGYELAAAITAVCDGQSRETTDDYNPDRSIENYYEAIRQKTASLMAAACKIGGLSADLKSAQLKAIYNYGEAFGLAFQLADDLLDFTATAKALGKPVGHDAKHGVYTLPVLLALKGESGYAIRQWLGKTPDQPLKPAALKATLTKSGTLDQTTAAAREQARLAEKALVSLPESPIITGLARLPGLYLDYALSK